MSRDVLTPPCHDFRGSRYDTEHENRQKLSVLIPDVQFSFAMSTECPIGHRGETSKDDGRRLGPVTRPEGLMSKKSGRNGRNSQRRNARRGRAKVAATGESLPKLAT